VRVLVTGGAGFIGSHVVDRLRAHGHDPRIFDLVESPHHSPDEVETVVGDLLDLDAVGEALRGCDATVHLAALADVDEVVLDPARADLVNVQGTRTLLEAARAVGVGRVVYASTIWVYGNGLANGNGHAALDEDAPLKLPEHFYTATKIAGEMYCRAYRELYGLEETILRFGIPYGPRMRPAAVLARFVARALAGEPLAITGDGKQSRQFVYVEDLAEGVVAALTPAAVGRIYNLVGTEQVSVRGVADTVRELVADVPIVHVAGRTADLNPIEILGARAARELDWLPATSFHEGARRYVDWLSAAGELECEEIAVRLEAREGAA